ncbi:MAG: dienelactone hydrolase family protein [Dokdonella sp.]
MGQSIQISSGGMQCIGAYVAQPEGPPKGGIVVAQEIFGVNAHIRSVVDVFANHGYTAIAPAFFDHLETGVELDYDSSGISKGLELVGELSMDMVVVDVASAAQAIASAGRIGAVGYCWGGSVALLAAIRLGMPAVSYYGARNVQYLGEPVRAPLQFHFGAKDRSIPAAAVERHRNELPGAEVFVYPAGHGFNCTPRKDYDAASATLALERTLDFFSRHLERATC